MNDTQAHTLREEILKKCTFKKKDPTIEEIHPILSTPYDKEFRDSGLSFANDIIDNECEKCIKKFAKERGFKIQKVEKSAKQPIEGYRIFEQ